MIMHIFSLILFAILLFHFCQLIAYISIPYTGSMDKEILNRLKHIETFYEQAPPGYVKDEEERPEDCIPDEDCNKEAREFLANAPKKGLWMPLGKEVKVMQCWRCKQYGHRTGDKECPLFKSGNAAMEKFREVYEDPMYHFVEQEKREETEKKKVWLQQLLDEATTSASDSDAGGPKRKKKKSKKSKKKTKKVKRKMGSSDSEPETSSKRRDKKKKGRRETKESPSKSIKSSHSDSKKRHRDRDDSGSFKKKSKS